MVYVYLCYTYPYEYSDRVTPETILVYRRTWHCPSVYLVHRATLGFRPAGALVDDASIFLDSAGRRVLGFHHAHDGHAKIHAHGIYTNEAKETDVGRLPALREATWHLVINFYLKNGFIYIVFIVYLFGPYLVSSLPFSVLISLNIFSNLVRSFFV